MISLKVWVTLPDADQVLAGELVIEHSGEQSSPAQAQFKYDPSYLARVDAFALDPINLPLGEGAISSARMYGGIHAVFEDALPDDWGRRLLIKQYGLSRQQQLAPSLLEYLQGWQLGALSFTRQTKPMPLKKQQASMLQLQELLQAAQDFERGEKIDDPTMQVLFAAGSSPGGARPKVLVSNAEKHYLVKFPSIKDQYAMVPLEAAALKLAEQAKLTVMNSQQQKCLDKDILLIERFDLSPEGGRRHYVSFKTLLQAEGYYFRSYVDIAQCIQKISGNVSSDLAALYRQMVFNLLLGNTDDHLKNFAMLHDGRGWFLSPAFDLVPNTGENVEHSLRFHYYESLPGSKEILYLGEHFALTEETALLIFKQVYQAVINWRQAFDECCVPQVDQIRLGKDINSRLERYCSILA